MLSQLLPPLPLFCKGPGTGRLPGISCCLVSQLVVVGGGFARRQGIGLCLFGVRVLNGAPLSDPTSFPLLQEAGLFQLTAGLSCQPC